MKKQLLFLSLFYINVLMAQVPSYVPTNGLVGYWPFNGNINDVSGNSNNGTVNGATLISDRFGNSNSAFSLENLSNNLMVNNVQPTLSNTSLSISLWLKFPTQWHQSSLTLVKMEYNIIMDSLLQ